ncbi:MAG: hypothetical protein V4487_08160 [Chlamydiota bacterium]
MFLLSLAFTLVATIQPSQDVSSSDLTPSDLVVSSSEALPEESEDLVLSEDLEILDTQEIVFDDLFNDPFDLEELEEE